MRPRVSVIMNTLNEDEDRFHSAVKCILGQEGVDIHLIVNSVEGDKSYDWIEAHSGIIEYYSFRKEDHPGKSPVGSFWQLNQCLNYIDSEWFIFASSNCFLYSDKYINEITAANKKGGYIGYSNFVKIHANNAIIRRCVQGEYDHKRHLKSNFIPDQSIINYKKLKYLLPFKMKWYNMGFWDFWLRVYEHHGDVFGYHNGFTRKYIEDKDQMHIGMMNEKEKAKRANAQKQMLNAHM